jgi:rod shape-determining protein MreD
VIPRPGAFIRTGFLILAAVVLQLSFFSQFDVFDSGFDVVPLVVAATALYAGSVVGSGMGFATGLALDMAAGGTVGLSSLVLTAMGYGAGRYREVRDPAHALTPIPVGAAATLGYVAAVAAVSFMLDIGTSVSALVLRDALVVTVLNALIALPVFAVCRRVLRPVLTVDPVDVRRRRRAPRESGPIGLRGLEV